MMIYIYMGLDSILLVKKIGGSCQETRKKELRNINRT